MKTAAVPKAIHGMMGFAVDGDVGFMLATRRMIFCFKFAENFTPLRNSWTKRSSSCRKRFRARLSRLLIVFTETPKNLLISFIVISPR